MKTLFKIRFLHLGGIACALAGAASTSVPAQVPELYALKYTASTSLSLSMLTESDTAVLLSTFHYPDLRLSANPQPAVTRTGAVQSLTLPLPATVYKGFLRLTRPGNALRTDLGYTVTDASMLGATGEAVSKHGEVTFFPDRLNNPERVLLATPQFQPLGPQLSPGLRPVGKPVGIAVWPDVTSLSGTNTLRMRYNAYGAANNEKAAMRLYAWNAALRNWEVTPGNPQIDTAARTVTAAITKPGVYALFTITNTTGVTDDFVARTQPYRCLAITTMTHFARVDSSAQVISEAGRTIYLSEGFHAVRGSQFTATIKSVTGTPNGRLTAMDLAASDTPVSENADDLPKATRNPTSEKYPATIFPNPVSKAFTLHYQLPVAQKVSVILYTLAGKQVAVFMRETPKEAGQIQDQFDASKLQRGVYILSLQFEKGIQLDALTPATESNRRVAIKFIKTQ